MPSELPEGLPNFFILARQALWAGDRNQAMEYLQRAKELVSTSASRRLNQFSSLEDVVAADIEKIHRELKRLEKRSLEDGDLASIAASESPYVSSATLRGVVYGDGFGHFYLRAYLANLDIESMFRKAVLRRAVSSRAMILADAEGLDEGKTTKNDNIDLADASREWIDVGDVPKVHVYVGEFPLIEAHCGWCPLPESGEKVRERFAAILRSIDPWERV